MKRKTKPAKASPGTKANPGRHAAKCTICAHLQREEIESAFVSWKSPISIAAEFGLPEAASVYRHAHALDLFKKRERNIRAALEKIIERAGEVEVTASAVVAAVQAYAKINAAGEWIDRTETLNLNDVFTKMSNAELDTYARTGALPAWARALGIATPNDSQKGSTYGK